MGKLHQGLIEAVSRVVRSLNIKYGKLGGLQGTEEAQNATVAVSTMARYR